MKARFCFLFLHNAKTSIISFSYFSTTPISQQTSSSFLHDTKTHISLSKVFLQRHSQILQSQSPKNYPETTLYINPLVGEEKSIKSLGVFIGLLIRIRLVSSQSYSIDFDHFLFFSILFGSWSFHFFMGLLFLSFLFYYTLSLNSCKNAKPATQLCLNILTNHWKPQEVLVHLGRDHKNFIEKMPTGPFSYFGVFCRKEKGFY